MILFVAVVATTICCFLCSCCYLYRRRQQLQSPFEGASIRLSTRGGAGVPSEGIRGQEVWLAAAGPSGHTCPPVTPEARVQGHV